MTSTNIRARRLVAAGAFAVAAVAAPFAASVLGSTASELQAAPACLAWFGNKEDGKCLSYSNGNGVNVGTPEVGLNGSDGVGINTSPMFPGQTINDPYR
ncbi:DUF7155 family protein [Mycolicibacterium celeriflavum]|uniref:Uncharacterized protein n=1 Tax=Mycolicibacterium celeriflavum TaxID=1249101 RepID=A0A1X0BY49_MYCCF|nr:hypothetical protein [Mycolicibacterium celeriflavum]MCV7237276.1 hypothetical protein [Mycolicibacterium celeriflavum]ORA49138.1 hypothetical protein BST21_07790 [Mycolicibacterium celeriflavum]BBY41972.1 hypothetical protein MCEL_02670 [Mycolicibacterium celeriflavum]